MPTEPYSFSTSFVEAERVYIQRALQTHGDQYAPGLNARAIEIALRDPEGELIGGLLGSTAWEWLVIDMLWIDEKYRRKGLGAALLNRGEQVANQNNCTQARTETFDFQALPFYQQYGYEVFAQLDGFPAGHTEFLLRKELS